MCSYSILYQSTTTYHVFYFCVHTTITTTAIIITTDFMEIEWNFLLHSNGPLQPELLSLALTYCRVVMPPPWIHYIVDIYAQNT